MARPIDKTLAGEIWHLSIEDLFAPTTETSRRLGGIGPFVINLSVSTAPIEVPIDAFAGWEGTHVYQIQVTEDGRTRYRLRLGPFEYEDEAEAILVEIRDVYPAALTATAADADLRAIEAQRVKREPRLPGHALPPEPAAPGRQATAIAMGTTPSAAPVEVPGMLETAKQEAAMRQAAPIEAIATVAAIETAGSTIANSPVTVFKSIRSMPQAGSIATTAPASRADEPAPPKPVTPVELLSAWALPSHRDRVSFEQGVKVSIDAAPVLTDVVATPAKRPVPQTPATRNGAMRMPLPVSKPVPGVAASPTASPVAPVASANQAPPAEVLPQVPWVTRPPGSMTVPTVARPLRAATQLSAYHSLSQVRVPPAKAPQFQAQVPLPRAQAPAAVPQVQATVRAPLVQLPHVRSAQVQTPVSAPHVQAPVRAPRVQAPIQPPQLHMPQVQLPQLQVPQVQEPLQMTKDQAPLESAPDGRDAIPALPLAVPRAVKQLNSPLPEVESTQTVRALTSLELEDGASSQWFVIQLSLADHAFDPDSVPNLDIFSEYRLYSVAGLDQGRVVHALRLGFFSEEIAAVAVASYLSAYYDKPAIKRVSVAERERFAHQRVEARKDVGASGRHAVIEITGELVTRRSRTTVTNRESTHQPGHVGASPPR